ncbi:MAG: hypothetical protein JKY09_09625 [Crocinitomicaceae bacterium]|nr:hypothetical protein [Crocinitomicaceae bacterium]
MDDKYIDLFESVACGQTYEMAKGVRAVVEAAQKSAIKEFKEELFKSISIMYRPHIEGVVAVIEDRLKQAEFSDSEFDIGN